MSASKAKGRSLENLVTETLNTNGIPAQRIPLSGSLGGQYSDDVIIGTIEKPISRLECKFRESISMQLWDWSEDVDYLVLKRSRKQPLVLMSLDKFIKLYKGK